MNQPLSYQSNSPDPLSTTYPAGVVILALSPDLPPSWRADTHTPREYDCIFMTPGRVDAADGSQANWIIPAPAIEEAAPLFDGVGVYLDHPALFGFGWRGDPEVKHLAGVTHSVRWLDQANALVGVIRLYDENP